MTHDDEDKKEKRYQTFRPIGRVARRFFIDLVDVMSIEEAVTWVFFL